MKNKSLILVSLMDSKSLEQKGVKPLTMSLIAPIVELIQAMQMRGLRNNRYQFALILRSQVKNHPIDIELESSMTTENRKL